MILHGFCRESNLLLKSRKIGIHLTFEAGSRIRGEAAVEAGRRAERNADIDGISLVRIDS